MHAGSGCGLRFPVEHDSALGSQCPRCGQPTRFVDEAYASSELLPEHTGERPHVARLGVLLDNVRSLRNTGAIFRSADALGVSLAVLGGITPTPAHPGFAKTALGAELSVPWRAAPDPLAAAAACIDEGWALWALEGGATAVDLFAPATADASRGRGIMLVLGHEVSGVDPRLLAMCERVLYIPMVGRKRSLNVSVAFAVAGYAVQRGLSPAPG